MLKENPDLNVTDISELLNVSRKTIYEWKKTIDNSK
jgi:transcriptional antiterminator